MNTADRIDGLSTDGHVLVVRRVVDGVERVDRIDLETGRPVRRPATVFPLADYRAPQK